MRRMVRDVAALALALPALAGADEVTGVDRLICSVGIATHCTADGECTSGTPEMWDIARFFEVHLDEGMLTSTKASEQGLSTPIDRVEREAGGVSLQGVEDGLAFSIDIDESTGELSFALATPGHLIGAFGGCTALGD